MHSSHISQGKSIFFILQMAKGQYKVEGHTHTLGKYPDFTGLLGPVSGYLKRELMDGQVLWRTTPWT